MGSLLAHVEAVEDQKRDAAGLKSIDLRGDALELLELLLLSFCTPQQSAWVAHSRKCG